jgi:diguanylate cyclase (GGDEF)-like protein
MDEMASWYRQGLRARVVALEQARAALPERPAEAADSIRRIAKSLNRPVISQRFGDIRSTALDILAGSGPGLGEDADRLIGAIRQASGRDDARIVKILVVEDSPVQSILTRSVISGPNREVLIAETVDEANKILGGNDIGLIVLDLTLPGADGRDLLLSLGQRPRTAAIPVILLTGRTDVQTRTEALALGADAYYQKPVESPVLAAAVSMMLERSAEGSQLGRRDPLTGLRNRRIFMEDVKRLAATAVRAKVDLSIAIMDIDRLSAINDVHGNEVGDAVVRSISKDLVGTFRKSDLLARWDGGQFAVVFSNARPDGAALALEKLRAVTEGRVIPGEGGAEVTPRWRAGISSIRDAAGVDDAVARATRRLHAAQRGASRIVSMDASSSDRKRTVLLIEDDDILADLIEHRLDRGGFGIKRFSDGAEALAGLASVDASAVVLDTMLPGAEGYEVLRRLKESPSLAGIPVIVLTLGGEHEATRAFKLGASDSLAKPFSVEELVARVTRLADASEEFAP